MRLHLSLEQAAARYRRMDYIDYRIAQREKGEEPVDEETYRKTVWASNKPIRRKLEDDPLHQLRVESGRHHVKVNGRDMYYVHISGVRQIKPGRWEVDTPQRGVFHVIGGYHSGGTHTEWWVWGGWRDYDETRRPLIREPGIDCTSMMDCLKQIENM